MRFKYEILLSILLFYKLLFLVVINKFNNFLYFYLKYFIASKLSYFIIFGKY